MLPTMLIRVMAVACMLPAVVGCVTPPDDPDERAEWLQLNDPLEPMNRGIFEFNMTLDRSVMKPVAISYRDYIPGELRLMVHGVLANLNSPLIFANDVLQGEPKRAATTFARAVVNTLLGVGGLTDVAAELNLPRHEEDAGQTFAVWGIGEGPYLMLPLLGPSNPRDTAGFAVEFVSDPFSIYLKNVDMAVVGTVRSGFAAVDTRVEFVDSLDAIERTSLDFYSTIRSVSRQHRVEQIRNHVAVDQGYGELAKPPR
jgi:phospholipid-binding lipoprotein MlaA